MTATIPGRAVVPLLLACFVTGCGAAWEGARLRDAQTRHGEAILDLSTTLRVSATRICPELAGALAGRRCDARQCRADERRERVAAAHSHAQRETHFILGVYTAKLAWNDLDARDSTWTVTLHMDGVRAPAGTILALRDRDAHARLFPELDGFDEAYEVSFPVAYVESRELSLTISGLQGQLRLDWMAP